MKTSLKTKDFSESTSINISQFDDLLDMQLSILEMISCNSNTDDVLERLCILTESRLPNSVASIMLYDDSGHHLNVRAAPSVPSEGISYLDGLIPGPQAGSCGTAVYTGKPVFVEDTLNDYRWKFLKGFAELFKISSCWSFPITTTNNNIIGSFALSSFENRKPDTYHQSLLKTGAHLVSILVEREKHQQRLQLSNIAFEHINEGIVITDEDRRIIEVNQAFTEMTGYTLDAVYSQNPQLLSSGLEPPEFHQKLWHELKEKGVWSGETKSRRKSGEVYSQWLTVKCVYNLEKDISHYVFILNDISKLKEAEDDLRYLAHHDTLTNLPNRLYFQDRLSQAISRAKRLKKKFGLLFIDIDNFKNINDSLGHQVGDRLLQLVSERLYNSLRKHDVIARLGGDEFIVLIENTDKPVELRHIADKIKTNFKYPIRVRSHDFQITASIGISIYPENGQSSDELLRTADSAMYEAKNSGRNRVAFYTPELTDTIQQRVIFEADLRKALELSQIYLNYQPQYNALTGELIGAEVLVRWEHPKNGMIPPSVFIPIAEDTGFICELGLWITSSACQQAQIWRKKGLKEFKLAINLSPHQLTDNSAYTFKQALYKTDFPPDLLDFEITESLLMESGCNAIEQLFKIREIGIGLALDDFGTGHSSMSQLKHLPIQKLKIDKSFVRDIPQDKNDVAITRSIIALGHALDLKVLAEGVETKEQVDFLRDEHCDELQGYFTGKPVSASDFEKILVSSNST
ncbi:MAG: EAL domain-containing protein [Candidatus Thiodiazotropha endolucinida]|nr:EAL domain-containing protein [Candidatus Thiodiazotropha taylori]MCG8095256.1 EAL domain-containing protein [Candidatus Thiodiazotropha endolucinida]MCW4312320.1 EAL domain-containing protein [Candidatus Thiodiazotropha taylori]